MKHTKTEYTAAMRVVDLIMGALGLFIFAGILLALYVIVQERGNNMKKVTNINLIENRTLYAIEPFEDSPLENHKGGEIAYDKTTGEFFVHEPFLIMYGTDAIVKAVNSISI